MLAKPDGQFISQRTHPRLCLIRATPVGPGAAEAARTPGQGGLKEALEVEELRFAIEAQGMSPFHLFPTPSDMWLEVQVHEDRFTALAGYEEGDRWFSDFLGEPCRLIFIPHEVRRGVDPQWADGHRVSLADGYPLHLATEESLRDVSRRIPQAMTMLRFRPNLVLAGGLPWEEDEWRVLEVGGITVHLVKPCARCSVVTVDQETGVRGQEPLRTLKGFREWEGKVYFGQNAVFEGAGRFRVGDDVHILERGGRRPLLPFSALG
jgi:uncharacterized protein YcbX